MPGAEESLAQRLLAGDRRALARGISLVENDDPEGWALVKEVYPHTGRAAVMGFTGPPGAGKSLAARRLPSILPPLEAAFQGGGVHLVAVPIDYTENTRVLVDELRARVPASHAEGSLVEPA